MATIPPAPPPPPPASSRPQPVLSSSRGPSTNRNNIGSIHPTQNTQHRSPLANIHASALQHAAANLRKTQYREPLLSSEPEQLLGRQTQLPPGGHWSDNTQHEMLDINRTGTEIPVSSINSNSYMPSNNGSEYSYSLNKAFNTGINTTVKPKEPTYGSSATSRWMPGVQAQKMYSTSSNNNNKISPTSDYFKSYSSTTSYYPPQPTSSSNYSYSSYSTSSSGYNNDQPLDIPNYPPPPPPPLSNETSNQSSYYSSTTTSTINPHLQQQQPVSNSFKSINNNGYSSSNYGNNDKNVNNSNGVYSASYISNPQQYIHNFATQTPIANLEPSVQPESVYQKRQSPPKTREYNFVEDLRNSTLTDRQKYANQFQKSNLSERLPPQTIAHIYEQSTADTQRELFQKRYNKPYPSQTKDIIVDELIKDMEYKMNSGHNTTINNSFGDICTKCQKEIQNDTPGVTALGKPYHVTCFNCDQCQKQLAGCSFYNVDGKNLCQVDYMNSLDKCDKCATPITQKILRAMGKAFHPECFACPNCMKSLDGTPFTVDQQGTPYCLDCYHERFSPRCAICLKAIVPKQGETEVARIVAMDRSYHLECYKCEDCGLQLNSKIEGQGCYPLESHLFCKNCNLKRLKAVN